MTNHDDHTDEEREYVRRLFAEDADMPRDVVPGSGMTRQDYLDQDAAAGTWTAVTGSKTVFDPDGMPCGATPPETVDVYRGGTVVTADELAAVGLTPADVPNLKIIEKGTNP